MPGEPPPTTHPHHTPTPPHARAQCQPLRRASRGSPPWHPHSHGERHGHNEYPAPHHHHWATICIQGGGCTVIPSGCPRGHIGGRPICRRSRLGTRSRMMQPGWNSGSRPRPAGFLVTSAAGLTEEAVAIVAAQSCQHGQQPKGHGKVAQKVELAAAGGGGGARARVCVGGGGGGGGGGAAGRARAVEQNTQELRQYRAPMPSLQLLLVSQLAQACLIIAQCRIHLGSVHFLQQVVKQVGVDQCDSQKATAVSALCFRGPPKSTRTSASSRSITIVSWCASPRGMATGLPGCEAVSYQGLSVRSKPRQISCAAATAIT